MRTELDSGEAVVADLLAADAALAAARHSALVARIGARRAAARLARAVGEGA